MIVNQVIGGIDDLAELGKNDILLALEMLFADVRGAHQVGDQFGEKGRIPGQRASIEDRLVARGPGVYRATDILDRLGERARVARPGAFENHVLDEMRETAQMLRLRARPDHRVEPDGSRFRPRKRIDRNRDSIAKPVKFCTHVFACCSFNRLRSANP